MKTSSSFARHSVVVSLPQPMYAQIKDELRRRILDGSYTVHQQLPSESELTQLFQVSRITVRQALNDLQKEGLIFRIHGKGTYVSKPKAFQELGKLEGFAEAMGRHGYETYNRLLSIHNIVPAAPVAARLRLAKSQQVTELRRVRYLNRSPISLDISYFPRDLGDRLQRTDLAGSDVFSILENELQVSLGQAELQIEAVLADESLAHLLQVEEGSPILKIERLTYTAEGTPVDFEYLYYRGDAFQYRLRVERENRSTHEHD